MDTGNSLTAITCYTFFAFNYKFSIFLFSKVDLLLDSKGGYCCTLYRFKDVFLIKAEEKFFIIEIIKSGS
jgi:hypothetical protein